MSYEKRGSYNHRNKGKQLLCFDGLDYDSNITPMDIDGMIEYHDRKLVLLEVKLKNTKVLQGQRLALQRLVDNANQCGKDSIAIVADHDKFDPAEDVYVSDCVVRELYHGSEHRWRPPKKMMTVEQLVRSFLLL